MAVPKFKTSTDVLILVVAVIVLLFAGKAFIKGISDLLGLGKTDEEKKAEAAEKYATETRTKVNEVKNTDKYKAVNFDGNPLLKTYIKAGKAAAAAAAVKQGKGWVMETKLLKDATAEQYAKEIDNNLGFWTNDAQKVEAVIKRLKYKTQVSQVLDKYAKIAKSDFSANMKKYFYSWGSSVLDPHSSRESYESVFNYINELPTGFYIKANKSVNVPTL